ncbi:hypothetical protein DL764_008120 [Monosporascus ibericus]|uniref:Uncharacterized protein n=1 Tax=Monosporascus ibericus TaxID=155417 RepID=A0A4Q4T1B3_9PEZI|nr:hypothetical protein DL764_008120 [Monosporascus ibericus]
MDGISKLDITFRGYLDWDRNKDATDGLGHVTGTDTIATLTMQMLSDSGIKRDTDLNGGPSAGSKNSSAAGFQLVKSTDQISNPFAESSSPNTSPAFLKSNSAIAAQGYVGKSTM